jgi:hypothetical protein
MKKKLSALMTAFILGLGMFNLAWAAEPLELVVPTPPGGAIDNTARAISKSLLARGHQQCGNISTRSSRRNCLWFCVMKKRDNVVLVASSANFVFLDVATNQKVRVAENLQLFGPSVVNAMGFVVAPTHSSKHSKTLVDSCQTTRTTLRSQQQSR